MTKLTVNGTTKPIEKKKKNKGKGISERLNLNLFCRFLTDFPRANIRIEI